MKDLFSTASGSYARFRPSYPEELINTIVSKCESTGTCLDVGTGSGQLVSKLAPHFSELYATDISYEQLKNAPQIANVTYHIQPAESTSFGNDQFDAVTVAQALHWFDHDKFYPEINRVLKSGGIFAAAGYTLCQIAGVSGVLEDFYENEIDAYWEPERRMVENEYKSIDFPFEEDEHLRFQHEHRWTFEDFMGYLNTWSAVKKYETEREKNPVNLWLDRFQKAWGNELEKKVITPIFLRIGRKN